MLTYTHRRQTRQPRQSCLDSLPHSLVSSSLSSSPLSSSITPWLFHSLKTYLFSKFFPPWYFFYRGLLSWSWDRTGLIMLLGLFLVCFFFFNFLFVPCGGLSWLHVSFLLHVKYTISYRIVTASAIAAGKHIQTKRNVAGLVGSNLILLLLTNWAIQHT